MTVSVAKVNMAGQIIWLWRRVTPMTRTTEQPAIHCTADRLYRAVTYYDRRQLLPDTTSPQLS